MLDGYDILATDLVDSASRTVGLFPSLRFERFDVLNPRPMGRFDDVLITGLDFYFDDETFSRALANVRTLLRPGGRLLFALRYRDNAVTWLIDTIGIPAACTMLKLAAGVGVSRRRWTLKDHGYRRSVDEVRAMAARHGFKLGRLLHAGFGVELTRVHVDRLAPPAYAALRALDRRLHMFNNAVVFEFLT
jgi:SAM-dependent methyltransferase